MSELQHIKDWVDKQIEVMETQFVVHQEGLGVYDKGAGYYDLGIASSYDNFETETNLNDIFDDGFYYGNMNGEYLKLCEVRAKLNGIDYNLEE